MDWTPEDIEQLKTLWSEGMTTAAIGKQLRVSKNAVVGKANRLGLTKRQSPIIRDKKVEPMKKKPRAIVTMADLTAHTCRWPSGDPKHEDFQFCGDTTEQGRPYCSPHCDLGYVASKPRTQN